MWTQVCLKSLTNVCAYFPNQHIFFVSLVYVKILTRIPRDVGGMLPVRASAQPSVAWGIAPWKYSVPKSAIRMGNPRRLMTVTVAINANQMTRKVAMEIVTREAGSTRPGQRWDSTETPGLMSEQNPDLVCQSLQVLYLKCSNICISVLKELWRGYPPTRGSVPKGSGGWWWWKQVQSKGQADRPTLQWIPLSTMEEWRLVWGLFSCYCVSNVLFWCFCWGVELHKTCANTLCMRRTSWCLYT